MWCLLSITSCTVSWACLFYDVSKCPDTGEVTEPRWVFTISFILSIKKLLLHLNIRQSDLDLRQAFRKT